MQGWPEVRAWRKAERARLLAQRLALPRAQREAWNDAITPRLAALLRAREPLRTIGFYWPFKGEYDPRPLMRALHDAGLRLALPVVVERAKPLVFRAWWPGIPMVPGVWNIPVPAGSAAVRPDVLVAPLVGFDARGYRLGYGGGYYDRTLGAPPARPLAIGVGFELAALGTIHPQPHDVPMDLIITPERTLRPERDAAAREREGMGEACRE
ncbi:5-formyltetrahydrofolate cyclo-ligase [Roseomonas sp. M0104]|uniref:5-formyltetrahydrofolate cyclo-ligase n=1 Tax=Teichococcus coralli TaxID=2545983 RepID=A0A845BDC6_9PROT|nr:5-formyltetrahydrofolate cyclo-ligase [Pseudoroseomonas coralli]MXP65121.1 5-formyltetrahydrofolate cyclo-ligase [Pseudoroseomonas coralli]